MREPQRTRGTRRRRFDSATLGTVMMVVGFALIVLGPALLVLYTTVPRAHEATPVEPTESSEAREPVGALPIRIASVADLPSSPRATVLPSTAEEGAPLPDTFPTGPMGPAQQIVIPRIGVDSSIVSVRLARGEWPVPSFVVGHLAETANPGDPGNAVFSGHIQTLSWGNVFAQLKELGVGDEIFFRSATEELRFRVTQSRLVRNTDVSVIDGPPDRALVTLITCEGRWLPREKDYDQRRIVIAEQA